MTLKNTLRTLAMAALACAGSMQAANQPKPNTVQIPFSFHVGNVNLPAGEYRVHQDFGKNVYYLMNTHTRKSVQVLRNAGTSDHAPKLVFSQDEKGAVLKHLS